MTADRKADLRRIEGGLQVALDVLTRHQAGDIASEMKEFGGPVTEADRELNQALLECLPRDGEGWLSEETLDDEQRLGLRRVWVVDPLDGTQEFIDGVPEWCVSIALVEDGEAVAGGIANPAAGHVVLGAQGIGVTLNGAPVKHKRLPSPAGAVVLASRSESRRGEWKRFKDAEFTVQPMGSVAYKLGCVAAGLADASWTLTPKNEWDVAAGCALIAAAGGTVLSATGAPLVFNQRKTLLPGVLAFSPGCTDWTDSFVEMLSLQSDEEGESRR